MYISAKLLNWHLRRNILGKFIVLHNRCMVCLHSMKAYYFTLSVTFEGAEACLGSSNTLTSVYFFVYNWMARYIYIEQKLRTGPN